LAATIKRLIYATVTDAVLLTSSILVAVYLGSRRPAQSTGLDVYPLTLKGNAIAGQHVVYLASVSSASPAVSVAISAAATSSSVFVEPEFIGPGQVAEVTVIPDVGVVEKNVTVKIIAASSTGRRIIGLPIGQLYGGQRGGHSE
jgi:hypothetical protein